MKISIIIPVFNKAEYIEACLLSLLRQDFDDFEIVAVDDGSTDRSGEICDRMAQTDRRIRVFHQSNGGVTAARRFGVEQSHGRYIMFVDSDDELLPHALQTMYKTIEETRADEVIGTWKNQYGQIHDSGMRGRQSCEPLVRNLLAIKNSFCVLWGIIFKKELLDGCLNAPREIIQREDSLMQIKCLMKSPDVYFIPDTVYGYNEGVPNNRMEDLTMIRIYDKELRQTLQPQWETYRHAFVHHQLKAYERFLDLKEFHVFEEYYRPLRKQLDSSIPLMDRIAILLPPRISYILIHGYKKLLAMRRK